MARSWARFALFLIIFLGIGHTAAWAQSVPFSGVTHFPISGSVYTGLTAGKLNWDSSQDLFLPYINGAPEVQGYPNRVAFLNSSGNILNPGLNLQLAYNSALSNTQLKVALGDLNGDHLDDLVILTRDGNLWLQLNTQIQSGLNRLTPSFGATQRVEYLGQSAGFVFPFPGPQDQLHASKILIVDLNQDGNSDVVVASAMSNGGTGITRSIPILIYLGDGGGHLQLPPVSVSLSPARNPTDFEIVDTDGDGALDRLYVLEEERSVFGTGVFETWLEAFDFHTPLGGGPPIFGPAFGVGNQQVNLAGDRATSLEVAQVWGGSELDFIFSIQHCISSNSMQSRIEVFEGGPNGVIPVWTTQTYGITAFAGNNEMPSLQVEDFDGDGFADIAALVGYENLQAGSIEYLAGPIHAASIVQGVTLGLYYTRVLFMTVFGTLGNYIQGPGRTSPDALLPLDTDANGRMELAIAGTRSGFQIMASVLKNHSVSVLGNPLIAEEGTGTPHSVQGTLQITGTGDAKIGRALDINLLNAPDQSVAGLIFGDQRLDFQVAGLLIHTPAFVFSNLAYTGGSSGGVSLLKKTLNIPNDPSLSGMMGLFQWNLFDTQRQELSSSPALRIRIGR